MTATARCLLCEREYTPEEFVAHEHPVDERPAPTFDSFISGVIADCIGGGS